MIVRSPGAAATTKRRRESHSGWPWWPWRRRRRCRIASKIPRLFAPPPPPPPPQSPPTQPRQTSSTGLGRGDPISLRFYSSVHSKRLQFLLCRVPFDQFKCFVSFLVSLLFYKQVKLGFTNYQPPRFCQKGFDFSKVL